MSKYVRFIILLPVLLLAGCFEKSPALNTQWSSPESIATEFFNAIYNDKDLEKAKQLSTEEYAALMESYATARQVGRVLLNMSFDSVTINVNRTGQNLRQQYDTHANITLLLSGPHNNKRVDEVRVVTMVKQRGRWQVKEVQQDKFSSSVR